MSLIVGAYPAAPPTNPWSPEQEKLFLDAIAAHPDVRGWEIPFTGALHGHDEPWLLSTLSPDQRHVVTAVPFTVVRTTADPSYGLASTDDAGRAAAIADMSMLRDAVARIPGRSVAAVEIHSAPRNVDGPRGSAVALRESLATLAGLDWSGAALVVEHCDAVQFGHPAAKGFLPLEDELAAVEWARARTGADLAVAVNWARSAIEGHSSATPLAHIATAASAGLLYGLMFSGVSTAPSATYPAWADAHLAPSPIDPTSLLGDGEIADSLRAAAGGVPLRFLGLKIQAAPGAHTPGERAAGVRAAVDMVMAAVRATGYRLAARGESVLQPDRP